MYDVAVVGGGAAGSYVAYALASHGHRTIVVEQRARLSAASLCTGIVGRECFDRFPGFSEAVCGEARSARFFSPSGEWLRLEKDSTQAYIVDRPSLDTALAGMAQEAGATYLLGSRVEDITTHPDKVSLTVDSGGEAQEVAARALVIASGFGSPLPRRLGLGRASDFVIGAQAEVAAPALEEIEVYFGREVAPGFFGWLVPTTPGKALAGLLARRYPGAYLQKLLARLLAERKVTSVEDEIQFGGIPLSPLPRTYAERLLVIGDAAGQVKPTTGGGLYYALLCAEMAAHTLCGALEADDLSSHRLAAYQEAWKGKLGGELRMGRYARQLFERLSDRQMERIFRLAQSDGISQALLRSEAFSFDWHADLIMWGLRHNVLGRAILSMTRAVLPF